MDEELRNAALLLAQPYSSCVMDAHVPAEDIRLRLGRPLGVTVRKEERLFTNQPPVDERTLMYTLEKITSGSVYSVQESLKHGYITARHGIRIGVCGTGITKNGILSSLTDISSLSIRVARQHCGISDGLISFDDPLSVRSTLIIAPPGFGKTSLLRDMIRNVSNCGITVAVADERGEIAAMHHAVPGFDIGPRTDVMDSIGKREAVLMLLKTMSPQVIAMDEISAAEDVQAVEEAAGNGVPIFATVHGSSAQEILSRPLLHGILARGIFSCAIVIGVGKNGRFYKKLYLEGMKIYAA